MCSHVLMLESLEQPRVWEDSDQKEAIPLMRAWWHCRPQIPHTRHQTHTHHQTHTFSNKHTHTHHLTNSYTYTHATIHTNATKLSHTRTNRHTHTHHFLCRKPFKRGVINCRLSARNGRGPTNCLPISIPCMSNIE